MHNRRGMGEIADVKDVPAVVPPGAIEAIAQAHGVMTAHTAAIRVRGLAPICIKASYLPHNHGFRPREHPPYNTHSLQVIGDSFGVFFFVYTTLSGELA